MHAKDGSRTGCVKAGLVGENRRGGTDLAFSSSVFFFFAVVEWKKRGGGLEEREREVRVDEARLER